MGVVTLHVALALLQVIASVTGHNICTDGPCISVYDCPPLLKLLQSKFLTPSIVSTLRQAQCNPPTGRSASFVCCASAAARAGPVARPSLARNAAATRPAQSRGPSYGRANQLPATCGVEPTTRKIIGGADVALDEFPWMAILEYERSEYSKFNAMKGGSTKSPARPTTFQGTARGRWSAGAFSSIRATS